MSITSGAGGVLINSSQRPSRFLVILLCSSAFLAPAIPAVALQLGFPVLWRSYTLILNEPMTVTLSGAGDSETQQLGIVLYDQELQKIRESIRTQLSGVGGYEFEITLPEQSWTIRKEASGGPSEPISLKVPVSIDGPPQKVNILMWGLGFEDWRTSFIGEPPLVLGTEAGGSGFIARVSDFEDRTAVRASGNGLGALGGTATSTFAAQDVLVTVFVDRPTPLGAGRLHRLTLQTPAFTAECPCVYTEFEGGERLNGGSYIFRYAGASSDSPAAFIPFASGVDARLPEASAPSS